MKKLISLLLVSLMVFATFSAAIPVGAETLSGTCGDGVTWEFDDETGVLTISGAGAMEDYNQKYQDPMRPYFKVTTAPWGDHIGEITSVVVSDGVTSIGANAFFNYFGLASSFTSLQIGKDVSSIGAAAFLGCGSLESITVDAENAVYLSAGNCLVERATGILVLGSLSGVIPSDGSDRW